MRDNQFLAVFVSVSDPGGEGHSKRGGQTNLQHVDMRRAPLKKRLHG